MTVPDVGPARYLPPDVAQFLRDVLSGTADRDLRNQITATMESAFQNGNACGYERGYLDGVAECAVPPRQPDILGVEYEHTRVAVSR